MQNKFEQRLGRNDLIALVFLVAVAFILFVRFFVPVPAYILPNSDLGTDLDREVIPFVQYTTQQFKASGELPTWRAYALSGAPLVGNPNHPVFYPTHWLALLLPLPAAFSVELFLHLIIAGTGLYLYLRLLAGLRCESALLGALLFAFTPRLIQHIAGGHLWLTMSLCWWPWALFTFSAYWRTQQLRWPFALGLVLSAQALNDGRYLAITLICLFVCTFGYLLQIRSLWHWVKSAFIIWGVALTLMVVLSAPMIFPVVALLPYTHRATLTAAEAIGGMPVALLLGMLMPSALRFTETFLYAGVGSLVLLLPALGRNWTRREYVWVASGIITLLLSLGANGGLYLLLYNVPGFSYFRSPERFYPMFLFVLAVLAAFGMENWLTQQLRLRLLRPLMLTVAAVYFALFAVSLMVGQAFPFYVFPHAVIAVIIVILLWGKPSHLKIAILIGVISFDLLWTGTSLTVPGSPQTTLRLNDPIVQFLRENMLPDERLFNPYAVLSDAMVVNAGINSADGDDVAQMLGYRNYINAAVGCDYSGYSVGAPAVRASAAAVAACPYLHPNLTMLRLLNIRYIVLPHERVSEVFTDAVTPAPVFVDGNREVYAVDGGVGRLIAVDQVRVVSASECLSVLSTIDPTQEALVEFPPPEGITLEGSVNLSIQSHERTPSGERFMLNRLDRDALLVHSEAWSPYITARSDAGVFEVIRVNCALQGLWMNAAEETVLEFSFHPPINPLIALMGS